VNVLCKYFICSDELDNNEDWCIFIGAEKEDCNEAVQSCPDCPRMYAGKMLDGHSNVIDLDEGQGKIGNSQQKICYPFCICFHETWLPWKKSAYTPSTLCRKWDTL
jgi:hypothetical protein